jgi:hypothetical protein
LNLTQSLSAEIVFYSPGESKPPSGSFCFVPVLFLHAEWIGVADPVLLLAEPLQAAVRVVTVQRLWSA